MALRARIQIALATALLFSGAGFALAQDQAQSPEKDVEACEAVAGNFDASIEACTRVLTAELRASARRQALALVFRALGWKGKGDVRRAATDLTEAIGLDETFALAYETRADLLRDNDQCDLAISDYDQTIKLTPDRVPPYINRGLCLANSERTERAIADLDQAIKLDAANAGGFAVLALSAKARLNLAKSNVEGAIANLDEAVKLDPKRVGLYLDRGTVWSGKGDNNKAHADFDQAIKLDENNAAGFAIAAWALKSALHVRLGDLDAAIADFDEAIKLAPKQGALYIDRAALWSRKGDDERAGADYQRAIDAAPNNATLYNARGNFRRSKGEFALALADYDQVIQLQPEELVGYSNRGLVRFYTGDFSKAVDDFKRVVDAQPNAYSMLMLYLSRARAGRKDARDELAKVAGKLGKEQWPNPVVEFFLGRLPLQATESTAKTPEQKCEAQFYIGQWQITRDAKPAALKALQTAVDSCPKEFVEYRGAVEELRRLK